VQVLVDLEADINAGSVLQSVLDKGDEDVVQIIVNEGADINANNPLLGVLR